MTRKNPILRQALSASILVLWLAASALPQGKPAIKPDKGQPDKQDAQLQDLYVTIASADNFTILTKAIQSAGLVDTLRGAGPFTFFAPTDEAFNSLPQAVRDDLFRPENKEKLKALLIYHIVAAKLSNADLKSLKETQTLKRKPLKFDSSRGVKVGNAGVKRANIQASNGIIHAINRVLMLDAKD
jgi:uncharacterized surface protein with fasciclin (FAS1) repeats